MNLQYFPSAGGSGRSIDQATHSRGVRPDAEVAVIVSNKISAKTTEKNNAITALNAACAQAEREELMVGSGTAQSGTIQRLVQTITKLEGELEYLSRAYTALGGE